MANSNPSLYRFRPSVWMTILALIVFTAFIYLGLWQLDRYSQKQAIQKLFQARLQHPALQLTDLPQLGNDLRYYPLQVTGHYDNKLLIFLDNRVINRQIGYQVLTVFKPNNDKRGIIIDRGWVQASPHRQQLPKINAVNGKITLTGLIGVPPKNPYALGKAAENPGHWPLRVAYIDIAQLEKVTGQSLYPFIILLDKKDPYGFSRDWQPIIGKPEKHLGYAIQWFAFATILFILYFVLNLRKEELKTDEPSS